MGPLKAAEGGGRGSCGNDSGRGVLVPRFHSARRRCQYNVAKQTYALFLLLSLVDATRGSYPSIFTFWRRALVLYALLVHCLGKMN